MAEKTVEEQYAEYAEFAANDPEEKEYQEAKKKRRAKNELRRQELDNVC